MKVAFVCEGFDRSSIAAQPWRDVYELANRMAKLGHNTSVISTDGRLDEVEEIGGVRVHRLGSHNIWTALDHISTQLKRLDVDLVNWHGGLGTLVFPLYSQDRIQKNIVCNVRMGRITRRELKNLTVSDVPHLGQFWFFYLYSLCPDSLIRRGGTANQVRRIVSLSEQSKRALSRIGIPEDKMVVIPSGVDLSIFNPSAVSGTEELKRKLGVTGSNVLLYFGSPSRFRGLDHVLKALPKIAKAVPSTKLIVLSRHPISRCEESHADPVIEEVGKVVRVQGIQSQETIVRFLAIADIVVLPFRFWPYTECPLTVLESMAMEKPLVTSRAGSISEIVRNGDNGLLVDPCTPDSIARTIVEALRDRTLCESVGKKARQYVAKHHNMDDVVRRTISLFEECLE